MTDTRVARLRAALDERESGARGIRAYAERNGESMWHIREQMDHELRMVAAHRRILDEVIPEIDGLDKALWDEREVGSYDAMPLTQRASYPLIRALAEGYGVFLQSGTMT